MSTGVETGCSFCGSACIQIVRVWPQDRRGSDPSHCQTCAKSSSRAPLVEPWCQRGFLPGRPLLDCILDIDSEMTVASIAAATRLGTDMFALPAASPSVQSSWIGRALVAQGVLEWLRRWVFGLRRCTGSLWGTRPHLRHPGTKSHRRGMPRERLVLGHFCLTPSPASSEAILATLASCADEVSCGLRSVVRGLLLLLPALRASDQAAGPRLHFNKTKVADFIAKGCESRWRRDLVLARLQRGRYCRKGSASKR